MMCLLSIRKMVQANNFSDEYGVCFGRLLGRIRKFNHSQSPNGFIPQQ